MNRDHKVFGMWSLLTDNDVVILRCCVTGNCYLNLAIRELEILRKGIVYGTRYQPKFSRDMTRKNTGLLI